MRAPSIRPVILLIFGCLLWGCGQTQAQLTQLGLETSSPVASEMDSTNSGTLIAQEGPQQSYASLYAARYQNQTGMAVRFTGTDDLHYYATPEASPTPGFELQIILGPEADLWGAPIKPSPHLFYDPAMEQEIEVFVGDFEFFVPLIDQEAIPQSLDVTATISGLACTSSVCLPPVGITLNASLDLSSPQEVTFSAHDHETPNVVTLPTVTTTAKRSYATWVYLLLAVAAGLSINIMPCVLPVIPLIIMRLIGTAKDDPSRRMRNGLSFCVGIALFFAAFALIATLIKVTTGQVLDLNSLFRYPAAVTVLFLAIVFFALVMLDIVVLTLPGAVAGHQTNSSTLAGSIGMGFFAGLLSTPCSGALLGFVLVWAQTQPLLLSNTAIILMGVGMALPYAIIASTPKLLDRVPKPGTWMELFKKSCGFLLLFIAVKLTLAGLPKEHLINVLLYGIIFSFCVWVWGQWVSFNTSKARKLGIRGFALALAVISGLWLLPNPDQGTSVAWQHYDEAAIQRARDNGQPVLIKFTADWCTNCKVLEKRVFHDPEVVTWLEDKNVLTVKGDTTLKTEDYPATTALKETYGQAGNVPFTVVWLPDGSRHDLLGMFSKKDLQAVLAPLEE